MTGKETKPRADIYARITDRIVADLERGVRPWVKPWNAATAAGCITRPLRHNGMPYQGINVVLLWSEAVARGFTSPIWMTFKQSLESRRPHPQGRDRNDGGLRQQDHQDRDR
ncbi:antirestriction protein ArdC (plasmid) [Bradyrhizobium guangxiense]